MTVFGYARVSTAGQNLTLQYEPLHAAGRTKIYRETASGVRSDRPQLALLKQGEPADIVVVTRVDKPASSALDPLRTPTWSAKPERSSACGATLGVTAPRRTASCS